MKIPGNLFLVLSGGNALGAYQAGAYEALHEQGIEPTWVAGASIGAINGAIIAGNVPGERVPHLRQFWRLAEQFGKSDPSRKAPARPASLAQKRAAATQAVMAGRPGLFAPRLPGLLSTFPWVPDDESVFDTAPLLRTLKEIIDFRRLNAGAMRLTVTATNVETGEDISFDTAVSPITAEHLRASAAFPVAFPPVKIGDDLLMDPGLSANLPLRAVLSEPPETDALCLAVDLFPMSGRRPRSLGDALLRAQDVVFAAQSRHAIRELQTEYRLRATVSQAAIGSRASKGPAPSDADAAASSVTLLHIAYSENERETAAKALDYSEASVNERWTAGYRDMREALSYHRSSRRLKGQPALHAYRFEGGVMTAYGA